MSIPVSSLPAKYQNQVAAHMNAKTVIPESAKRSIAPTPKETNLSFFTACGVPKPEPEYRFHLTRKWRFDYAWPDKKLALEVEGGVWTKGRHTRGSGFIGDMKKYNTAATLGWRILRVQPSDLMKFDTMAMISNALLFA